MMKSKIIDDIWYESESGSSYHVLSEQVSRPKGPLSQRVSLDPPNGDPSLDTCPLHLTPTMFLVFKTQSSCLQSQRMLEWEIQLQSNNRLE